MRWPVCLGATLLSLMILAAANGQLANLPPYQPTEQQPEADSPPAPAVTAPAPRPANELEAVKQELKETKDRLRAFEDENETLRRRNDANKSALRKLDESLAVANAESEFFRRQYSDLRLKMEAFGMESVGDNKEALEQRLLKAVRDLALTQQAKDELSERLVALSEAVMLFIKSVTSADPQLRLDVEGQLRAANLAMDESVKKAQIEKGEQPADLTNAKVISVKDEYALVVGNIGARQGVKAGMPFRVLRGDHGVARVRVVSVRDRICGAVVEEYASNAETVKVGDQMHVDAQQ